MRDPIALVDGALLRLIDSVNLFVQRWLHVSRFWNIAIAIGVAAASQLADFAVTIWDNAHEHSLLSLACLVFLVCLLTHWMVGYLEAALRKHRRFEETGRSDRLPELWFWPHLRIGTMLVLIWLETSGTPTSIFDVAWNACCFTAGYLLFCSDLDRGDREEAFGPERARDST